jgi:hypothetical protein
MSRETEVKSCPAVWLFAIFQGVFMHDLLIGLAFVGMVICPAVVARFSRNEEDAEDDVA